MNKVFAMFGITAMCFAGLAGALTDTEGTDFDVVVAAVCGLSDNSTGTQSFGTVAQDAWSDEIQVQLVNNGNTPITELSVWGSDWTDGNTHTLPIGYLTYKADATDCTFTGGTGTNVTTANVTIGTNIDALETLETCYRVYIPTGTYAGTYTTTVYEEATC